MTPSGEKRTTRVLAFTASRHQPLLLRHCILQMQAQTYRVDHAIFVNSPDPDEPGSTTFRYDALLDDATDDARGRIYLGYGQSFAAHQNYVLALSMVEPDDYDLFLRVDDDGVYLSDYVEGVVQDFDANQWDYSATHAYGVIEGHRWLRDRPPGELGHDVSNAVPATAAFSRRGIGAVIGITDDGTSADAQWRQAIANAGLVSAARRDGNYTAHRKDGGV